MEVEKFADLILTEVRGFRQEVLGKIHDLDEKFDALAGDVKQLQSDMTQVKDDIELMKGDIKLMKGDIKQVKGDIKLLQAAALQNARDITDIKKRLDGAA